MMGIYNITVYSILLVITATVFITLAVTYKEIRASISNKHTREGATNVSTAKAQKEAECQKKVTRIFLLMSCVYFVTIIPKVFGTIVVDSYPFSRDIRHMSKTSFHFVYILSAVINPILTFVFKPDYKMKYNRRTIIAPMELQQLQRRNIVDANTKTSCIS